MKLKTRKRIEHVWKESPDDALNHAAVAAMKRTGAASLEIKFHDDGWYVAAVPRLWLARAIAMRRDIGTAHLSNVVEGCRSGYSFGKALRTALDNLELSDEAADIGGTE